MLAKLTKPKTPKGTIIAVRDISKVFRMGQEKIKALWHVDLDIKKGEITCLLGTSGSGKSTFLNLLSGIEKPTAGEIWVGNIPIHRLNEQQMTLFRQKNIGFIFQSYQLMPMLTALENVALPLALRGINKRTRNKQAQKVLKQVGLAGYEKRRPSQMSGGQQQRVGIARAILSRPKIIFADEPTGNLDSKTSQEVIDLLQNVVQKAHTNLILVTHDPKVAKVADRIITLQDGQIINIEEKGATDDETVEVISANEQ